MGSLHSHHLLPAQSHPQHAGQEAQRRQRQQPLQGAGLLHHHRHRHLGLRSPHRPLQSPGRGGSNPTNQHSRQQRYHHHPRSQHHHHHYRDYWWSLWLRSHSQRHHVPHHSRILHHFRRRRRSVLRVVKRDWRRGQILNPQANKSLNTLLIAL